MKVLDIANVLLALSLLSAHRQCASLGVESPSLSIAVTKDDNELDMESHHSSTMYCRALSRSKMFNCLCYSV